MNLLMIYFWSSLITSLLLTFYLHSIQFKNKEHIDYLMLFSYMLILLILGPFLIVALFVDKIVDVCSTKK